MAMACPTAIPPTIGTFALGKAVIMMAAEGCSFAYRIHVYLKTENIETPKCFSSTRVWLEINCTVLTPRQNLADKSAIMYQDLSARYQVKRLFCVRWKESDSTNNTGLPYLKAA